MSARQPWDSDARSGPAWVKNLVRRPYLVATEDERDEDGAERSFETTHPCAVGDIVSIPPSVLEPHAGADSWKIVAREAAAAPYAARLIVTPANL